jgi:hypothetical protein
MKPNPSGNGSSKFNIHSDDMIGWVRVWLAPGAHPPDDLPVYLALTLAEWFRKHPDLRLRFAVPIQRDGNTVELHGWYEMHVFRPPEPGPSQQSAAG